MLKISTDFILAAIGNPHVNHTNSTANSSIGMIDRSYSSHGTTPANLKPLAKRDAEPCTSDSPCLDSSCCSTKGTCGYGLSYCSTSNCVSNCNATAMCGIYRDGGALKCGMNLCCSHYGWCGTDEIHCGDPDPKGLAPCQAGFGLCQIIPPPSYEASADSANGRSIGYYQASNTRDRLCNRVSPSQIITVRFF